MIEDLFARQLSAIAEGDLEALLAQYHKDAMIVRLDRVVTGSAEIRAFFTAYLDLKPQVQEIKALQTVNDTIFYNAVMTLNDAQVNTFGTLIIRDTRIWRQTAAALHL
ncbi:nuclear transport factor 2 family protein [Nonomuraea sp. NPDC050790]|uniref:nuclear transport factor 2 family protein n=1 Tax=Nonomuraea sp. NPDC050790 TaxID=3364371 RepID=UPI00378CC264